jgi:hypothetical protein
LFRICFVLNVRHKVATRIDDGFDRVGRIGVAFRQGKEFGMIIGGKQQIEVIVASFDLEAAGLQGIGQVPLFGANQ